MCDGAVVPMVSATGSVSYKSSFDLRARQTVRVLPLLELVRVVVLTRVCLTMTPVPRCSCCHHRWMGRDYRSVDRTWKPRRLKQEIDKWT